MDIITAIHILNPICVAYQVLWVVWTLKNVNAKYTKNYFIF